MPSPPTYAYNVYILKEMRRDILNIYTNATKLPSLLAFNKSELCQK